MLTPCKIDSFINHNVSPHSDLESQLQSQDLGDSLQSMHTSHSSVATKIPKEQMSTKAPTDNNPMIAVPSQLLHDMFPTIETYIKQMSES